MRISQKERYKDKLVKTGQNIRSVREEKAMTVSEVSRLSQVSESAIRKIESGESSSRLTTLVHICSALGVEVAYIISD